MISFPFILSLNFTSLSMVLLHQSLLQQIYLFITPSQFAGADLFHLFRP
jgi:hypothetical protein